MIVHWEQLDERERQAWLDLVAEARLAGVRRDLARLDEVDRELKRFGIIFRPVRLVGGAVQKIRLAARLTKFLRLVRGYEQMVARHDSGESAGRPTRATLIGFARRQELGELELASARWVRHTVDEVANV